MAFSSQSTDRLPNFLANASSAGVRDPPRSIGLERLAGRPIGEILRGITEFICPLGGSIDESIAREAFIETFADLIESGITISLEQIQTVLELNIARAIEGCQDLGTN